MTDRNIGSLVACLATIVAVLSRNLGSVLSRITGAPRGVAEWVFLGFAFVLIIVAATFVLRSTRRA